MEAYINALLRWLHMNFRPTADRSRLKFLSAHGTLLLLTTVILLVSSSGPGLLSPTGTGRSPSVGAPAPPTGTLPLSASGSPAPGLVAFVPIRLNATVATIPAGTDVNLTVDFAAYAGYLDANLTNVEFLYPNGTAIPAWLQNGSSSTSKASVVWLDLGEPLVRGLPQTILLGILGPDHYNLGALGPWGEAPQLSITGASGYGRYDDGASVFPAYANGTTGATLIQGVNDTVTVGSGISYPEGTGPAIQVGAANPPHGTGYWLLNVPTGNRPLAVVSSFQSDQTTVSVGGAGVCTPPVGSGSSESIPYSAGDQMGFSGSYLYLSEAYREHTTLASTTPSGTSNTQWNYATLDYNETNGSWVAGTNSPSLGTGAVTERLAYSGNANPFNSSAQLEACGQTVVPPGSAVTEDLNYVLVRYLPPDGVMPQVRFLGLRTPSVTVLPATATNGTTVFFNGTGFGPGDPLDFNWSGWSDRSGTGPTCPATFSPTGNFSCLYVVGGGLAHGGYPFNATDPTLGLSATTSLTLEPSLRPSVPQTSPGGAPVYLNGSGFTQGSVLTGNFSGWRLKHQGMPACPLASDARGAFSCIWPVYGDPNGTYELNVTDSQGLHAQGVVRVGPALRAVPSSGVYPTAAKLVGAGYAAGSPMTVDFPSAWVFSSPPACPSDAGATGNFSCGPFPVPPAPNGSYPITATDGQGNSASVLFAIGSGLTASRGLAGVGEIEVFHGTGFSPSATVTVTSSGITGASCAGNASGQGSFQCSLKVPTLPGGPYQFTASDGVHQASTSVTVTGNVTLGSWQATVGANVSVLLTGFEASASVNVRFSPEYSYYPGTDSQLVCSGTAGANGTFPCLFQVPAVVMGYANVSAADLTSGTTSYAAHLFWVAPSLTVSPGAVLPGANWTLHGSGFGPSYNPLGASPMIDSVLVSGGPGDQTLCTALVDVSSTPPPGTFGCGPLSLPAAAAGPYTVTATESTTVVDVALSAFFGRTFGVNLTITSSTTLVLTSTLAATASVSPGTAEVGQPVSFQGSATLGVSPYHFLWTFGDGASSILPDPTHTYATPGSYSVVLTVVDALGSTVSTDRTVPVLPALTSGSISAAPESLEVGQASSLSVPVSGGIGPFTYLWGGLPPGCASQDAASMNCTPTAPGSYLLNVTVEDALGAIAHGAPLLVTVAGRLGPVDLSGSSPQWVSGEPYSLGTTVEGGLAPYTFVWAGLPSGCSAADLPSLTCTAPAGPGFYNVTVTVTDALGVSGTSGPVTVQVIAPLTVTLGVTPAVGVLNGTVDYLATVSGGYGTDQFTWWLNGSVDPVTTASSFSLGPLRPGTYAVQVSVADARGDIARSPLSTITVYPPPAPSPRPAPAPVVNEVSPVPLSLLYGLLGLIALVVLLTVGVLFLVARRRGPAPASPVAPVSSPPSPAPAPAVETSAPPPSPVVPGSEEYREDDET